MTAQPVAFTVLSALLLLSAYPLTNFSPLAWVALVPLLHALAYLPPHWTRGWWFGYLHGLVFYAGLLYWLTNVTVPGYCLLVAYLACYSALFAAGVSWFYYAGHRRLPPVTALVHPIARLLFIPAWWVCLEWLRAHLLTGFGWGLLGYTQTPHPFLIQSADVAGAYGVSWLIVLVNVTIGQCFRPQPVRRKQEAVAVLVVILLIVLGYSGWRWRQPLPGTPLRLTVVQGNIPQEEKWDVAFQRSILDRYETLTQAAVAEGPALIIWPETAVPGLWPVERWITERVQRAAQAARTPLLVGTPSTTDDLLDPTLWNSALLLDADGQTLARYHKLHLVPFGEYIPLERQFPWLRQRIVTGDFDAGREATVFTLANRARFSVLICFEDIFPELGRRFVAQGAQFLVNLTNDAWFGRSSAADQHLQASVFRAVECRVPVVRGTNTGVSGFIDAFGRVSHLITDTVGNALFVSGTATADILVADAPVRTLYLRWGDWWVGVCAGLVVVCLLGALLLPHLVRTR